MWRGPGTRCAVEVNPGHQTQFIRRVYTQAEQQHGGMITRRWRRCSPCTKKAFEALGTGIGKVGWQDFEILHGKWRTIISLGLAKTIAERELTDWAVSITHENGLAVAMVVAQGWERFEYPGSERHRNTRRLQHPHLERFGHVDLVVACGDLPHYYLEYVITDAQCAGLFT